MGFAPLADTHLRGAGFAEVAAPAPITDRITQVVQMAVGDASQSLETGIPEHLGGSLAQLACGGSREGGVQGVDLYQQPHILARKSHQ